jgi:hypothetical protein
MPPLVGADLSASSEAPADRQRSAHRGVAGSFYGFDSSCASSSDRPELRCLTRTSSPLMRSTELESRQPQPYRHVRLGVNVEPAHAGLVAQRQPQRRLGAGPDCVPPSASATSARLRSPLDPRAKTCWRKFGSARGEPVLPEETLACACPIHLPLPAASRAGGTAKSREQRTSRPGSEDR